MTYHKNPTMVSAMRMLPVLFFLVCTRSLCAAEPLLEKSTLFTAGQGGYALYRIPGIVITTRGTILAYCEARKNASSDWGHIDILLRRSTDAGKTWSDPRSIATVPPNTPRNPVAVAQRLGREGEITLNNPVAIADRDGTVHFLYCVEYGRCFYMRSTDDGLTFSSPTDITPSFDAFRAEYDWKVLATGPGHGIQLNNGRLLVPVWLSLGTGGHAHRPSCVSLIYSDDRGNTWKRGQIIAQDPNPKNPSETVPVQLADGSVMFNIRHEGPERFRAVSTSPDGVANWSPLRFDTALPEPVCMASIVRADEKHIVFANPQNPDNRTRKNLTIKLSDDDGKNWKLAKALEPGLSAYSDLAAAPDGTIYCLYESGGPESKTPYQYLTLARFNVAWIMK